MDNITAQCLVNVLAILSPKSFNFTEEEMLCYTSVLRAYKSYAQFIERAYDKTKPMEDDDESEGATVPVS